MYVFNRKSGKYLGRAGHRVRDIHTGERQKMNPKPPKNDKGGCFGVAVLVLALALAPVVAAVASLARWV